MSRGINTVSAVKDASIYARRAINGAYEYGDYIEEYLGSVDFSAFKDDFSRLDSEVRLNATYKDIENLMVAYKDQDDLFRYLTDSFKMELFERGMSW